MWREDLHDGARRVALGAGGQEGLFWWGSHDLMLKHTALALYAATVVVAALLADASDDAADADGSDGSAGSAGGSAGDGSSADDGVFDPTKLKLVAAGALFSVGALLLPTIITDYTVATHVGELSDTTEIEAALARLAVWEERKQQRRMQKAGRAASLLRSGRARLEAALDGEGAAVLTLWVLVVQLMVTIVAARPQGWFEAYDQAAMHSLQVVGAAFFAAELALRLALRPASVSLLDALSALGLVIVAALELVSLGICADGTDGEPPPPDAPGVCSAAAAFGLMWGGCAALGLRVPGALGQLRVAALRPHHVEEGAGEEESVAEGHAVGDTPRALM
jgi:hypothetical protein